MKIKCYKCFVEKIRKNENETFITFYLENEIKRFETFIMFCLKNKIKDLKHLSHFIQKMKLKKNLKRQKHFVIENKNKF